MSQLRIHIIDQEQLDSPDAQQVISELLQAYQITDASLLIRSGLIRLAINSDDVNQYPVAPIVPKNLFGVPTAILWVKEESDMKLIRENKLRAFVLAQAGFQIEDKAKPLSIFTLPSNSELIERGWIRMIRDVKPPVMLYPGHAVYIPNKPTIPESKTIYFYNNLFSVPRELFQFEKSTENSELHTKMKLTVNSAMHTETTSKLSRDEIMGLFSMMGLNLTLPSSMEYNILVQLLKVIYSNNWIRYNGAKNQPEPTPIDGVNYTITIPETPQVSAQKPKPKTKPKPKAAVALPNLVLVDDNSKNRRPSTSGSPISSPLSSIHVNIHSDNNKTYHSPNKRQDIQWTLDKFEKDIEKPEFLKKALQAEELFLEEKAKRYKDLLTYDWSSIELGKASEQKKSFPDVIREKLAMIQERQTQLVPNEQNLEEKKKRLQSLLYNRIWGIQTIKGESRNSIKQDILRTIYMFLHYPKTSVHQFLNIVLLGSAGTGKTSLGKVLSQVFYALGINLERKVKFATSQDLIAGFSGQTAIKTRKLLQSQLEGVLFIDEAYTLSSCKSNTTDHMGSEAIAELINFLDKFMGCLVVIIAGYPDEMRNCLLKANEGLPRRFPQIYDVPNFSSDELVLILHKGLRASIHPSKLSDTVPKQTLLYITKLIRALSTNPKSFPGQAGDIQNITRFILEDTIVYPEYTEARSLQTFQRYFKQRGIHLSIM